MVITMKIGRKFHQSSILYPLICHLAILNLINSYSDRIDCLRSYIHNKSILEKEL